MKKILLSLFTIGFIVSGFIFLVKPVMADPLEEGCLANQNYSTTTGQRCGCSHNEIYSSTTGLMCARDSQVIGYLTEQGPSITMWGTHSITNDGFAVCVTAPCPSASPSYLVSAGNSSSVLSDLQRYENGRVKITGRLQWYDLEGGFWGFVATDVTPISTTGETIKVISPNGGEIYKVGETMNINWSTNNAPLNSWILLEINGGGHLIQQKISVSQNHFSWVIPTSFFGYNDYPNDLSLGNNYKIKIKLLTGINSYCVGLPNSQAPCLINPPTLIAFDESDNYFSIVSSQIDTPVISGISGPQSLNVNQVGTWKIIASDMNDGNLSYSVNWGDNIYREATSETLLPQQIEQQATFTHTYTSAGVYNPVFTVSNSNGVRAETSLSVRVGNFFYPIGCNSSEGYSSITGISCNGVCVTSDANSNCYSPDYTPSRMFDRTLRLGYKGQDVKNLQSMLGINSDGSYGQITKAKVMQWQIANGLTADGIFGPASRMKANTVQ